MSAEKEKCQILWKAANGETLHLTLDIYTNRTFQLDSEVTEHPVESGGTVVDHIRPVADIISIQGLVSNQPAYIPLDYAEGASQFVKVEVKGAKRTIGNTVKAKVPSGIGLIPGLPPVGAPIGGLLVEKLPLPGSLQTATAYKPDKPFNRIKSVANALKKLRDDKQLVSLTNRLIRYDNLAIQSLQIAEQGPRQAIVVSMTFKQVRTGSAITVEVPSIPTERVSQKAKTTKPATIEEPEQSQSVLSSMFGG